MSLTRPQQRLPYAGRLHRLLRTSSHLLTRRSGKADRLKGMPSTSSLGAGPDSPVAIIATLPPTCRALPPTHDEPEMRDFLRGTGPLVLDTRTLSWESTTPEKENLKEFEDRPRETRISRRRISRDVPRTPPQRRQKSSLGFLASWKMEEYEDDEKEQEQEIPAQQTTVIEDSDNKTPWQNARVTSKLNLHFREIVTAGLDRRQSSSSDDTANTPWDAPSPAKTATPRPELTQPAPHSPQSQQSQEPPHSPQSQQSQEPPQSPESPLSHKPPQSPPLPLSPVSHADKTSESEEAVNFSSVSESSLPPGGECTRMALFKVQPVTAPASQDKRVSSAGSPATAEELIRRSSRRSSVWEKIFDGVPKPCRNKWSNAVIGATSQTVAPPSAKHVRTILDGLREGGSPSDRNTSVGAVLFTLRDRIESPHWAIRLKTALFCHTVFRAGNQKFVEYVARAHADLFDPVAFIAEGAFGSCEQSIAHGSFAKEYAGYLQKWLAMKAAAKFPAGRTDASSARRFKSASSADLLSSLPRLLDTLDRVAPLELYPGIEESPLGDAAISLVLRDSRTLLTSLDAGVKRLVTMFFGLPDQSAVRAMAVYARYVRVSREVRPVLGRMRGEGSAWMQGPDVSAGLVGRMQTYIESGCRYKDPPTIKLSPVREDAKRKGEDVDAARRKQEILETDDDPLQIEDVKHLESDDEQLLETSDDEQPLVTSDDEQPLENSDDEQPLENSDDEQPLENSDDEQPLESSGAKPLQTNHGEALETTDAKPFEVDDAPSFEIFDSETQETEIVRPFAFFDSETQETEVVKPLDIDEDLPLETDDSTQWQTYTTSSEQYDEQSEEEAHRNQEQFPQDATPFPLRSRYPSDDDQ